MEKLNPPTGRLMMSPLMMLIPAIMLLALVSLSLYLHNENLLIQFMWQEDVFVYHAIAAIILVISHVLFMLQVRRYVTALINDRDNNKIIAEQKTGILQEEIRQHKAARNELQRLATHDQLTGAGNRRHFKDTLNSEMERYKRYRTDFSILILDLDRFQKINDVHGHDCGDFVLQKFAKYIQANLRQSDVFVRYGGQEFAIIAPGTHIDSAKRFADKLCQSIETQGIYYENKTIDITVSIGVGSPSLVKGLTSHGLINATEKALRLAEKQGRNQALCVG